MAVYRFSIKHGSRAKGTSAGAHVSYILRQEKYKSGAHELRFAESGNLPQWAQENPKHFWDSADLYESANARLYTEFEVSLPRELSSEQQTNLAREFIKNEIGDRHPYTIAIHESRATDGGVNPHFHLMFSTRKNDGIERRETLFFKRANSRKPEEGGAPKDRSWMPKARLQELRLSWEAHANRALEAAGASTTIDSRSLKDQGIDRAPQPKLTPMEAMLWRQGVITDRVQEVLLLQEIATIQQKQAELQNTVDVLSGITELEALANKVRGVLAKQDNYLTALNTRRETADRTVDSLTEKLSRTSKTQQEALKEARALIYGRAYSEHSTACKNASERLQEAARKIKDQANHPVSLLQELPTIFKELKSWVHIQHEVRLIREAAITFKAKMQSPKIEQKCQELAKKILLDRDLLLAERNKALEEALRLREQIDSHRLTANDLGAMFSEIESECMTEYEKLPPMVQIFLSPDDKQIQIGQKDFVEKSQAEQLEQAYRLELALSRGED